MPIHAEHFSCPFTTSLNHRQNQHGGHSISTYAGGWGVGVWKMRTNAYRGGGGGSGHRVCPQGCPKGKIICSYSQIYILFLLVPAHLKMFGCELLFPSKISSDWVLLSYIIAILWKIAVLKRMSRVDGIWGLVSSYLLRITTAHNKNSCFWLMEFYP